MINSLTLFLMGVLAISEKDITQDYIFKHQGLWMHPSQQYVVRLHGCENGMCGTIAWLAQNAVKRDVNNKDDALKGRALCGLRIVNGLATDGHVNVFKGGKMYRTDEGRTTSVKASYLSSDEVQMHSYQGVSMIGDTQVWLRVAAKDHPPCTPVAPLKVVVEPFVPLVPVSPSVEAVPVANEELSDFVEEVLEKPAEVTVQVQEAGQPIVLTPVSNPSVEVMPKVVPEAIAPNKVIVNTDTRTTNSNFKTKPIQSNQGTVSIQADPVATQQPSGPRTLQLEVIE